MVTLNRILDLLGEQRRELLDQLEAVDKAIAALSGAGPAAAETPWIAPDAEAPHAVKPVVPTRLTPRRVLTDAHKHAISAGKRKARDASDAAKGLAREMPDEAFVPAIGT